MTIEITREDLLSLAEAAKNNGSSLMLMLKTTDGKRATLVVSAAPKRIRRKVRNQISLDREAENLET